MIYDIIGIAILCFIFIYLGLNINKEARLKDEKESILVSALRITLVLFGFIFLMFIPKAMTDEICEPVIDNTIENYTTNTSITTNEYDLYCYENNNNTAASFYRVFLYFLRFFYAVFFIWFLVHVINYHKEIA